MEAKIEKIQEVQTKEQIELAKLKAQVLTISEYRMETLEKKIDDYKNDVKELSSEIKTLQKDVITLRDTEKIQFADNRKIYALATGLGGTILSVITYIITAVL